MFKRLLVVNNGGVCTVPDAHVLLIVQHSTAQAVQVNAFSHGFIDIWNLLPLVNDITCVDCENENV